MHSMRGTGLRRLARGLSAGGVALSLARWPGRDCEPRRLRALPIQGAGAVRCEGSAADARWAFKPAYRGQLTPARPSAAPSAGSPLLLHGGPFGARWIRVAPGATPGDVTRGLEEAADGAKAAIYVGVPDDHRHSGPIVAELRRRDFKFHHFVAGSEGSAEPSGEMIYYRWTGQGPDTVPAYSTALEGIGVLVLSPDGREILLAWEYGVWKMITGNVDTGDSIVDTAKREVREEVGLEVEEDMTLVGGWQDARSRDELVNNAFFVFLAKAKSKEVQVDGLEISQAHWFPLEALPTAQQERQAALIEGKPFGMEWDFGMPGQTLMSRTVVRFLNTYREGRGLKVQAKKGTNELERRDLFL